MENNKIDNLVDYFFVCGLDYEIGLDSYEISNETDDAQMFHCIPPLRRPFKPSILQKFPEHCGTLTSPEDYCITSLCMPDGLRLFTSSSIPQHPINHNFIIIREDASRLYGTALLFAEEIDNDDIKLAVTDLQNMYKIGHHTLDGRHSYCSDCVNVPEAYSDSGRDSGLYSSSGTSLSGISCEFWNEDDQLFTLKAIGVLSQHAFIQCHQSWLYDIWLMVSREKTINFTKNVSLEYNSDVDLDPQDIKIAVEPKVNLESYVYNMLFEVNAPSRGKLTAIDGPSMKHYCHFPNGDELPTFELPIRGLLEVLGMENLIRVYSCVMLEYRVVILSQDYRLLMLVAECITTLLFPFVWSHVYAPILPLAARHFLNAPVPFIMGIKLNNHEEEDNIQLASDASVCYVNIDRHTVTSSDDIPTFPYELDLRREITEILVNTINHQEKGLRLSQGRRQSLTPNSAANTAKENVFNFTHTKVNPATKNVKHVPGGYKPPLSPSIPLDDFLDITSLTDNRRRGSTSSITRTVVTMKPLNAARLPKDAGISVHELMIPALEVEDYFQRSQMVAAKYTNMLKSNKVFRQLFFNHFLHIFYDYEQFIIPPKPDTDIANYFVERESAVQAFDKAGFLSEQPETHLPFLSAFLETQMFANFIDMKILSVWHEAHPNIVLFERSLRKMQHTISSQLHLTPNSDIHFKPYFKSSKLIDETEKQFELYLESMNTLLPVINAHVLSCNDSNNTVCPPMKKNRYCSSHHHHHHDKDAGNNISKINEFSFGTDFPMLQGDCLRYKPRKKSVNVTTDFKIPDLIQDSEHKKTKSLSIGVQLRHKTKLFDMDTSESNAKKETRARIDPKPYLPNIVPAVMAQNHWTFVNTLLLECKAKTKRMVLEKMGGQEAVELGHGDLFVSGIEENTLVACLCDLLERIWCHGLNGTHGKSALWSHLLSFVERDKETFIIKQTLKDQARRTSIQDKPQSSNELLKDALTGVGVDSYCLFRYFNDSKGDLHHGDVIGSLRKMQEDSGSREKSRSNTPDFINKALASTGQGVSELFFNWNQNMTGSLGRTKVSSPGGSSKQIDLIAIFGPQRRSLVTDVKAIKLMTDIKTDVGLARAFVRLALEKKLLSEHLKKLLSDCKLLRELYKRHAFLRCEEEREQFLFHLLALQAVEYYSFTNLYIKSQLVYRVFIYSGKRFSTGTSTTANAWFCVNGQHCSTGVRMIPKGIYQFEFENQNLGILTTMRIGHDNSGLSAKWYIDFVLLQNLITGQVYRFPCNHWLGKSVDDGSTERLLIGELIRMNEDDLNNEQRYGSNSMLGMQTPPHSRSPSLSRRQSEGCALTEVPMIQEQLGNAVNNLVKYFCRQQDREKITINSICGSCNVTLLLCGEGGLVSSLERVFTYGFKSSRLFQKKFFIWDYLEKVASELSHDVECQGRCMTESGSGKCSLESSCITTTARIINIQNYCKLVEKISNVNQSVGKDGRFQRFVCLSVRDHMFPEWIELFSLVDCTQQFYEDSSFFRDARLKEFLIKILSSLCEYVIPLEPALTDNL